MDIIKFYLNFKSIRRIHRYLLSYNNRFGSTVYLYPFVIEREMHAQPTILCGHQISEFSREELGSFALFAGRFRIFLELSSFLEELLRVLYFTVVENSV